MKTVTVAIADLSGKQLDYAVAQALNGRKESIPGLKWGDGIFAKVMAGEYSPTTNWAQGGPLIDRFNMDVCVLCADSDGKTVEAEIISSTYDLLNGNAVACEGGSHLDAICRAVVYHLTNGYHVTLPEGLDE